MSSDELFEFQSIMDEIEEEQQEEFEIPKNDFGLREVLRERQKKKDALRERLIAQNLNDDEIEKLFEIIENAEEKMEKIKSEFNYKAKIKGAAIKMREDLIAVQVQMKNDFDKEFMEILKSKRK